MPLSWNEIKSRALAFSREWADETSEDAEAKPFWNDFFNVFGVSRRRVASFESRVKKIDGKDGYIDLLWKGMLLIEHKSRGKDLDRAYSQALDYFPGLKERELPKYLIVSDFARFRLYDLDDGTQHDFALADLHKYVRLFGFISGYQTHVIQEQDPVNIKAAERMGKLHDQLQAVGYDGHPLELYLVRLLFCLFAEDTGIFERQQLQDYLEQRTSEDGSDLGDRLASLFHNLNSPPGKRLKNLDEQLAAFPYINGKLFAEQLPPAAFDAAMRQSLLDCCALDWSRISPAIFGSLFQSIMDKQARRNLGAHYTSEKNILKLLKPLFLDELWAEFHKAKSNRNKLFEFHNKLRSLTFLDPACGCGNFLVITYRELRLLELDVLRQLHLQAQQSGQTENIATLVRLDVDQFYGIEIEEFPAQIAQVAMWLMDHQMNLQVSQEFGLYFARIPLAATAHIVCGNALQLDWNDVVAAQKCSLVIGNPPFLGKKEQSAAQKADMTLVMNGVAGAGVLDFVAAWYVKTARYMAAKPALRCAFVSTNSITQGEQVGVLWSWMLAQGIKIHFAHRTFAWSNEARGKAAVHCVIVGFGLDDVEEKTLFEYENIKGEALAVRVGNVSPYLIDAPSMVIERRMKPICSVSEIVFGSKAVDFGHFVIEAYELDAFLAQEPGALPFIREFIGGEEFLNGSKRYCLWLKGISPQALRAMPSVLQRVEAVKEARLKSVKIPTRKLAKTPTEFGENRQPETPYLLIPKVSSERREYVPLGFLQPEIIINPSVLVVPNATRFEFGVLQSAMHMAWMRAVCGRMKSDYQYSAGIVYNNFPWPDLPAPQADAPATAESLRAIKLRAAIETAAEAVLAARAQFPEATLADLYDPLSMPPALLKAHQSLDKAVDAAYGKTRFNSEAERVAFLFELYLSYSQRLAASQPTGKKPAKKEVRL
ncbi:MAG: class I SAM-dependent DNA methyltransferase [Pseudomonadaceae bacterium]|nr:class I SAM-dependent DNA methyltransferase [Pseudomonadaceae bacterium]